MDTPEVVVAQLPGGRLIKAGNADALGVHATEDMSDGAILPARIHPLQHDEKLFSSIDKESLLQICQPSLEAFKLFQCFLL